MKNSLPLVSIIIPYYKKKKFLKQTLESIQKQSFKNYEIIFIYDDQNLQDKFFVSSILKRFSKYKLIFNKKNCGAAKSRNKAFKYAKGKFIAFIDADDIWDSKKLKIQVEYMLKYNSDLSYTSYYVINEYNKKISRRKTSNEINYLKLIKSCEIGLSSVILKKKILKNAKFPDLKTQEDYALWLKLLRMKYKFLPINKYLVSWRKTENSLSSNIWRKLIDSFTVYYKYEKKNFINSIYSVIILSISKLLKINYD